MPVESEQVTSMDEGILQRAESVVQAATRARSAIGKVVFGQEEVVDLALTSVLAGGHALLVGVPGLAKTKLVDTMGIVLGLSTKRVQFTPDLMPSDILGAEILEESAEGHRAFRFIQGPVFTQLLMADEINRASPRTQSALLQAMQEQHVTVAGSRHDLPHPFHVLATQNPIEQEGTYPLPEAQLDRFMFMVDVGYPSAEEEVQIVRATTSGTQPVLEKVLAPEQIRSLQDLVLRVPAADHVIRYAVDLVRRTRPAAPADQHVRDHVAWGAGPRASQALIVGAKARAALDARPAATVDDVRALAEPVLRHRVLTNFHAEAEGVDSRAVIAQLLRDARG